MSAMEWRQHPMSPSIVAIVSGPSHPCCPLSASQNYISIMPRGQKASGNVSEDAGEDKPPLRRSSRRTATATAAAKRDNATPPPNRATRSGLVPHQAEARSVGQPLDNSATGGAPRSAVSSRTRSRKPRSGSGSNCKIGSQIQARAASAKQSKTTVETAADSSNPDDDPDDDTYVQKNNDTSESSLDSFFVNKPPPASSKTHC